MNSYSENGQALRAGTDGRLTMRYPDEVAAVEVQEGSLKACHGRTLSELNALKHNTELLSGILYKLDGQRNSANQLGELAKTGNADKEPDHPTFTARKIENMLGAEIDMQRAIIDQINRSIG